MPNKLLKWIFFFQCQLLLLIVFYSEGFEGGADAVCHWMISKAAPSDPILFLDQWNKPIFTLLTAPFAQLGFMGMRIFSTLTGILTAIVLQRTAKIYLGQWSWLPAVILLLIPQYVSLLSSSMTEPLFGLFISLFFLLVSRKKMASAAIVGGLLPFVRQEGLILLPIALFIFLLAKELRKAPFLILGTVIFAIIGWLATGDTLWIVTSFPYSSSASAIYGSGNLFHYLNYYPIIFGTLISAVLVVGVVFLLFSVTAAAKNRTRLAMFELTMLGAFLFAAVFFAGHSYVWWKGMSGSLGLIRVMACIAPQVALIAAMGIFRATQFPIQMSTRIATSVTLVFISVAAYQLNAVTRLPSPLGETQTVTKQVADWMKTAQITDKIHYSDPMFSYFIGEGADVDSPINKPSIKSSDIEKLKEGEYIVWDAHFSPSAGRMPLDTLLYHPYLKRVKSFNPERAFKVLGNRQYTIHVFRKIDKPTRKKRTIRTIGKADFELPSTEFLIQEENGRNNSRCAVANQQHPFITIRIPLQVDQLNGVSKFNLEAWIWLQEPLAQEEFFLVSDVNHNQQSVHYLSVGSNSIDNLKVGKWQKISQSFELPETLPESFTLACYIWHPGQGSILVDDLKLEVVAVTPVSD